SPSQRRSKRPILIRPVATPRRAASCAGAAMPPRADQPIVCEGPADFRRWLKTNHARADAVLVLFYKTGSGRPSMTWPQGIEEALCFGWIDGVRNPIDADSYTV